MAYICKEKGGINQFKTTMTASHDHNSKAFDSGIDLTESTLRSFSYEFDSALETFVFTMHVRPSWSDSELIIRFEDVLSYSLVGETLPRIHTVEYREEADRVVMTVPDFGFVCARRALMINKANVNPKQTSYGESGLTSEDFREAFDDVADKDKMTTTESGVTFSEKYLSFTTAEEFFDESNRLREEYRASPYCIEDEMQKGVDLEQCNSMAMAQYKRMLYNKHKEAQERLERAMEDCAQRTYDEGMELYAELGGTADESKAMIVLARAAKLFMRESHYNPARDFLARFANDCDEATQDRLARRFGNELAREIIMCKRMSDPFWHRW